MELAVVLAALGVAAVGTGALVLRRTPGYTVGRTLLAAPQVGIAEAASAARRGEARYVRVSGRITSEEEFPDDLQRPLVFRRKRLEAAIAGNWRVVDEDREAVPFALQERAAVITIEADALDEGLVVLPREASGRASEVPGRLPATVAPDAHVRLRVDQVSAVEHAHAAGVPRVEGDEVILGPGQGRPLILTTLELAEAMRVLGASRRNTLVLAAVLLVTGIGLIAAALVAAVATLS